MGWLRVMRPGSVIGAQQGFLCRVQRIRDAQAAARRAGMASAAFSSSSPGRLGGPAALTPPALPAEWLAAGCGFAAVLGHVYPVFHGFRGGKGVATLLGTLLALSLPLLLGLLAVWLLMMMVFGYVGLGSMVAAAALPLLVQFAAARGALAPGEVLPLTVFGVACAAFVVWTHRSNIARMRAGTEPHARKLWLLGRLTGRS